MNVYPPNLHTIRYLTEKSSIIYKNLHKDLLMTRANAAVFDAAKWGATGAIVPTGNFTQEIINQVIKEYEAEGFTCIKRELNITINWVKE